LNSDHLVSIACQAAVAAQKAILEVYHSNNFQSELKGDLSPLTIADKRAHEIIVQHLSETGLPVLSEEGSTVPFTERSRWPYFWMVDPLDGTKEFLQRNGDFTVNIALIREQESVLGVVAVPVTNDLYFATQHAGAFLERNGKRVRLTKREAVQMDQPGLRVVASRNHLSDETRSFIDRLSGAELVSRGSSLKFLMVAEGLADIYPRFAPTMEWDTAAAQCVVSELGIGVTVFPSGEPMCYNKPDLLNPWFLVKP
jgi:3'(2'), 5'-bisphosphate nucleotidase